MNATQLFFAPGTSPRMQRIAQTLPAFDLLKAYRDAVIAFKTTDVVLVVASGSVDGFIAKPRNVYVEEAFNRWSERLRKAHPLASESAHHRLKMPNETPAFWLVVEFHESGEVGCCAIGTFHQAMANA